MTAYYRTVVKLVALLTASVVIGGYLYVVLSNAQFGPSTPHKTYFTDASLLTSGSPVRVAGVQVGKVTGVKIVSGNRAEVDFNVDPTKVNLTVGTTATVRFKDLIGNRYLELAQPAGAPTTPLKSGTPIGKTYAALDLDTLFNGFKPLFQGLNPPQINALSGELVQVFQGEGGAIYSLLSTVSSLTSTLAGRDQLIGEVIDNLNVVLSTVAGHNGDLGLLVDQLRQVVTGLRGQAPTLLTSIGALNTFTASATDLISKANPSLNALLPHLQGVSANLNRNSGLLNSELSKLPGDFARVDRLGSRGDFFSIFLCGIRLKLTDSNGKNPYLTPFLVDSSEPRCH